MIIGICGLIGSGKDTIADYLVTNYNFKKLSFADKLKDSVATMFDWDRELLDGKTCLLYTSPSPRDATLSRMPSSA